MNKLIYTIFTLGLVVSTSWMVQAGNPDRQGEAGAYELLLNPWARSAGLHAMTTSNVKGVEAMFLNVAGMSRINKTEIGLSQSRYLTDTGIKINTFGIAQRVGKGGAFGATVATVNFGDIPITTNINPEGTGGTFSPSFFNVGLSYAQMFENKVSVGITFRFLSEALTDVSASAFSIDAGVQYVTGPKDNFKFGISLRNVGSPTRFGGEGLSFQQTNPDGTLSYDLTYNERSARFDLPSQLNIGGSYDFWLNKKNRLTAILNFTSNSFSRDEIGGGLEYSLNEIFQLRVGYKYDVGNTAKNTAENNVYTGLCAGVSVDIPLKKGTDNVLGIDYSYLASNPFSGTHNIGIRLGF